jgi:hypothetical protein
MHNSLAYATISNSPRIFQKDQFNLKFLIDKNRTMMSRAPAAHKQINDISTYIFIEYNSGTFK